MKVVYGGLSFGGDFGKFSGLLEFRGKKIGKLHATYKKFRGIMSLS